MNNLLLLGIVIISLIIFNNNYKLHSVQAVPNVGDINVVDTIPDNSFVKPQHKLLELLNNVSSADKLYLVNVVSRNSFTKSTLSPELNEKITSLLKIVIGSINNVSDTDFYIKNIDNLYVLKDNLNNARFIVDAFIYDIKNFYTIRINIDLVIYQGENYINYLDIDESAVNNILNNYDIKYHAQGILSNYNMFSSDVESLLNEYYKENYKLIGVGNSSLEYDNVNISGAYTLKQLTRNYLPSGTPNSYSPQLCKKDSDKFNNYGINFINEVNSECVAKNNALQKYPNSPYDAPGVVTNRVDFNAYDWLKNPINGNILYSHGFNL